MKTICIIGGGFSGAITAVRLLLKSKDVKVKLINSTRPLLSGVAYSTRRKEHLLNVPAGKMSAFPEEPDHFINWLDTKPDYSAHITGKPKFAYVQRMAYNDYLQESLAEFLKNERLEIIDSKAVDVRYFNEGYRIFLEDNSTREAQYVVYAMGNFPPAPPKIKDCGALENGNYFPEPWNDAYLKELPTSGDVLLVGTGLSMIDCMLSLEAADFKGKIIAVSPRGYLPETHTESVIYKDFYNELSTHNLQSVFHTVRTHLEKAAQSGIPWQSVIDSVRPHASMIWKNLSMKDKQQFISHLRHIWGLARHRLPSEVHKKMSELIGEGKMEVIAGRIQSISAEKETFLVSVKKRKDQILQAFNVSRIVNCTGPQINFHEIDDPLVRNLLLRGLISPHELKMGIRASENGQVLNSEGKPLKNIYAVGSLLRGVLWETTSVPELRNNAENLAQQIIASID